MECEEGGLCGCNSAVGVKRPEETLETVTNCHHESPSFCVNFYFSCAMECEKSSTYNTNRYICLTLCLYGIEGAGGHILY